MGLGDIFKIGEFKQEISRLQTENENLSQNIQQLQQAAENMRNQLLSLIHISRARTRSIT